MKLTAVAIVLALATVLGLSAAGAAPMTFTVNSTADRVDSNPGDGLCRTSAGTCTVRAAIQESNALTGADTIIVPAGVYSLQLPTVNEDLDTTGDFDIHSPMTILGAGAATTIMDAGFPLPGADPTARGLDRLFEIHPSSGNVLLRDVTIREGFSVEDGGAIQNWSPGLLRLENVHVLDSYAGGAGGGLNNANPADYEWVVEPLVPPKSGRVEIVNSTLSGNAAGDSGAAVNNSAMGTISILVGSRIVDNPGEMIPDPAQVIDPLDPEPIEYIPGPGVYQPSAGAISNQGADNTVGTIRISDSIISGNFATRNGAGVLNEVSGVLVVESSTITGNETEAGGGGLYTTGGSVAVTGSTISGNVAADGGGILSNGSVDTIGLRPRFSLSSSTISGNTAHANGGGMLNAGEAQLTIADVTFSGNKAHDAGGGLNIGGQTSAALARLTVTGNETNNEGGGAWIGAGRLVTIEDSTFTGNDAGVPTPGDLADPAGANVAGGGGLYTEGGPVTISGSTFADNTATEEGGGLSIDNLGDVTISDSVIRDNRAAADGGGVENSGTRVTFERLLITGNRASLDGGGIYSSASGLFTILDTTVQLNSGASGGGLANAPDNHLIVRNSLFLRNVARPPVMTEDGDLENMGHGGGIYSLADGDSLIENTTISSNTAGVGGGGIFHDADGELRLVNLTIWRNSAPRGGGVGVVESDFSPEVPPKANVAVISENSIIGGSLRGGSCDWYITSDGGNLDGLGTQSASPEVGEGALLPVNTYCFLAAAPNSDAGLPAQRDRRSATFTLDAIADNGGPTLTHALQYGSLAIDAGVSPCPATDQRGITRPQNGACDTGAYEFVGPPPPSDDTPPETALGDPLMTQDGLETMLLHFSGTDNLTPQEELQFECRLFETELSEAPEPLAPWDPIPPELWWVGCSNPWQVPLLEAELGLFNFEVRAIDRAGNVDPTPEVHIFSADDPPPDTLIVEKPPLVTNSRSATFTFSGTDNLTPPQFMEFECRLDSRDPEMWLECTNPTFFSNLTSGQHTLEVRAYDGAEQVDPSPARYTWTVAQGASCNQANITLTPVADGWVDEVNPFENYLFETELTVRSDATGNPEAVPPEPVIGQNARTLMRFALPTDVTGCELESATLRLYNESPTEGRTLEAVPLGGLWAESTLTWFNQPGTLGGAATTASRLGYQEWNVTSHVEGMLEGGVNYGWQIRDAAESDLLEGGEQSFLSREMPQDPPEITLPQLVLRYGADTTPPPPAPTPATTPTTVHCGQVLTESTLLANDLIGCIGEGLVIGAPDIVVDLNGHTITSGALIEPGEEDGLLPGIRNGSRSNVVIRNGTISGFGYGVLLGPGTTYNVVEDLRLTGNILAGAYLLDADDGRVGNTIRNNHFDHNGETGLTITSEAENSLVEGNTFIGNGMSIHLFAASGHTIEGNQISGIVLNPLLDSDAGIVLEEGSNGNVMIDNDISDTGDAGVIIHMGSHGNRVEGGTMTRNGDAGVVIDDSDRNQVIGIVAHMQSDAGVTLSNAHDSVVRDSDLRFNPSGVAASGTNNLVVESNDVTQSLGDGIAVGTGINVVIRNNVANRTGGAGIMIEGGTFDALGNAIGGALIEGNTANENASDGISVAEGGHTIRTNTAHNNAGFGIVAGEVLDPGELPGPGANIDGGGNVAAGNAEPEQCRGVVCAPGDAPPPSTPDTTAPETTILSAPTNPTGSSSATFTFTADDGPGGLPLTALVFECRLDPAPDPAPEPPDPPEPPEPGQPPEIPEPVEGVGWSECVSPVHYNGLDQGMHHFEVRAMDQSDNFDLTPATHDWEINVLLEEEGTGPDSVPPDTRIASAPSSPTTSTTATFHFAGTDNSTPGLNLTFECSLNGAPFTTCMSPVTYSGLAAGTNTFAVQASDRATTPNTDPTPATHTWEIVLPPPDTTAPDTTIDSGPDPITTLTSATFTFSSDEAGATFECSLDGAAFAACASPSILTGLPVGARELQVRARDAAGNVDASPAVYAWTVSGAPVPTTVFCGQVLTQSTLVSNDLHDCLWDGLVIGADGITIDLGGHTIDGTGIAAGIRNDGFDSVSIKNGTVVEFDYGVMLNPGTERNIIEGMTLQSDQEAGIALGLLPHPLSPILPFPEPPPPTFQAGVRDNTIRGNTLLANDLGIWLTNATRGTLIRDNEISVSSKGAMLLERSSQNRVEENDVVAASDAAIKLVGSSNNVVADNTLTESDGGVFLGITDSAAGYLPSDDNLVERNIVTESGGPAFELTGSSNSTVSGNQILDNVATFSNGEGLLMAYASDTLARGNDLRNNSAGISLKSSSENRLEANDTSDSDGTGISVSDLSLSNEIVGNTSSNNTGAGIYVGDETAADSGSLIEGNTTHNNTSYGIHVPKPSHIVRGNIANENGTWGIYASEGSNGRFNIDGGGNRAQGNLGPIDPFTLQPLQCYVILCTGGDVPPDQVPPDTLLLEAPPNPSTSGSATFNFTGSDNQGSVTFECRLDGGAYVACTSPHTVSVGAGGHAFDVRSVDVSGNPDPTPAAHSWTVNPSPGAPNTTIDSGPDSTTVATSATFEFSASESGVTFQCALDGGAFAACTSPTTYTGLGVSTHTFQVRATDSGGDTDPTPATFTWTIGSAPVPATVGCGEIVIQSIRLQNDLFDCGGHGLIVGANGITIDLDGHTIDGVGLDAGILNNGFDAVTITNGTVTQFDYGLQLNPGTSLNVLSSLRVEANQEAGILFADADQNGQGNTIRDNTILANSVGIWVGGNTRFTTIRNNTLGGNAGDGVYLEFASDNLLEGNEIARSGGHGIAIVGGGSNTIVDNTLATNGGYGIAAGEELLPSNDNRIERNTINAGQGGILVVDSDRTQVLYNVVHGSSGPGVALELASDTLVRGNDVRSNASGIEVSEASGNRIEANNASGTLGTGISIEALSYSNVVVQNTASQNGGEGIAVEDFALVGMGNLLDRNTADGNGGDGIGVYGAGHTLTGNSATMNGGWGIYVAVGGSSSDGGGNFAAGNAEPAQCFGIVCTIGTVPGAPETWIVEGPADTDTGTSGIQSNSRNASFTYMGSDDATPLTDLVFECRLDSTNDLAWEDCEYPAEYLNLSAGPHVFEVRTIDMLGAGLADPTPARYEWTYVPLPSGVAPLAILDIVPPAESQMFEALFTFHSNEPDVTFECRVDNLGYEPCGFEGATFMSQGAYVAEFEETQVGSHTFSVRAIDFEGNVGEPATYTWSIMGIVTTFTAGPAFTPSQDPTEPPTGGEVAETTATLDFIANVADATYECSLDLEPFTPCTPPVTYTNLTPGDHMLRVVATDLATGASEMEAAVYEWEIVEIVDVTPPNTSIERAPATNTSSTIFEFTGTDDLTLPAQLTFQCRVDSTNELDWFECTSPFNLLDLYTYADPQMAPGQHTFEVRAIDMAEPPNPDPNFEGNVDPTPATHPWTMVADTVAPGTGILTGPPATVGAGEILIEFFGTDNATPALQMAFECAVDAAPFAACESPVSLQGLGPGEHTFRVRAVDLAGNADATPATRTFTVVSAPVTTITSGPAGQVVGGVPPVTPGTTENAVFVFSSNQVGSTFECALDGGDFAPCTSPWAFWVTESGTHELEVRATNLEGVVEEPAAVYEWVVELSVDSTPPNTTITSGPSNPSTSEVATFSFIGSDNRTLSPDLTFECSLDGAGFNSCVSPQQFSDLTHASHTLLVRAVDAAGNFDPTPASRTWVVELPPVVTILSGPAEQSDSADATFTFESNVAGSTFTCWLDGLMEPCTSPKSYAGLATGEHLFAVLATAPGGTTGLQWEEYEWEIGDFTAPVTTISSGPDAQTESTSATFVFSSEPGVTFMCSLDGSEPLPCTSPHELPFVWPGAHTFEVFAITSTLLVEPVVAIYEWTIIDLEAPTTAIEYGPPATATSINAFFGFSSDDPTAIFECSLDGTAFAECDPQSLFEGLPPGPHTLLVRAVDVAGNVDATPASFEWTIVAGALNTPAGTNVVVELPLPTGGPATLTFLEVTAAGSTTLDVLSGGPSLPPGYSLAGGSFYDVNTTAEGEPASLCFPYSPAAFPDTAVRLLQLDGATWIDVTTLNDPAGRVCGLPEEFGVFAVAAGSGLAPLASIISGPPAVSNSGSATFTFWADMPGSLLLCSIDGLPFVPCTSPVTYTHLEEGSQEFQVTAIGPDGQMQLVPTIYEWEVVLPPDTTAPETTITRGAPLLTVNSISIFEFAGTDDQTQELELEFECSLDGAAFEQCETPEEIEVTIAGEHTLLVRAVDITGNADPTPAVWEWTVVDMSAPDTSIDLGPEEETGETTATFEFTGEEPDGTPVTQFECSLDNAEFASCTSPHTVTGLFAGPHVFQVRAVDPAGTVDPTPDFYEWLITGTDVTPPDTFILAGPPPGNSGPDVIFGFAATEPAEFQCSLDGAPFEGCEALYELLGLAQGDHTLAVRAIDLAEPPNVDATPATYAWSTLGEPNTTITSGPPDPSGSFSATFTFTSDQPGATFQCAVDGTPWVPCTSPFLAGPLLEDTHELEVRAVNQFTFADGSQVVDQTPATYEWTIEDITPPDTTITAMTFLPPTDLTEPNSFKFEFTGSDNRTASFELDFECSLDGGPFEGCESPHFVPLEELGGGEHELEVRAIDDLDNIDPTPASHVWEVEGEPETTILTGPAAQVESTEATFTFSSDQAGATFECSLDLAPFTACSSPVTFTGVPYGEHELQVRAVSPEGTRADLTPAVHAWESGDMTPPVVTIASGPAASTTDTTATFTFSADDPDALFQCSLDGSPLTFCTSPATYTGLLGGAHTLEVHATKPNLLVEGVPAIWEWTVVDESAPETTIVASPPALVALDAPAAFTFSSSEPDASFECALDGGPFEACAGPPANSASFEEAAGEHTLLVRAVDPSLNADASPESASWTVIAPPDTAITGPASPSVTASATFTFVDQPTSTFECSLDGAAFAACTSPVELADLPNGEHVFRVRATTALGVVESPAAEHTWTVAVPDTSAPETTIDSGPPASTPGTTALFTFSASELDATFECSLDGAAFAGCSSPLQLTGLPAAAHTLQVRAVDQAGNADPTPASYPWTVTAPPADNTPVGSDVSVTVEAGDGTSATVTFSAVTAAGATSIVALTSPPALPTGYLTAGAAYYDLSTTAAYTAPIEVCIEYAPASIPEPARLLHFEGGVWEDVTTSADPGAGVICGVVDSLSPFAIATGTAAVVPETTVATGPPATTISTSADFAFSSSDPMATFECSLDDPSDWGSCAPTTSFTGLAVGDHELLVRAKNAAGLFDATPARYEWSVLAPPETTILTGPEAVTESTTATFTFSSDQPGATFECLLDDAPAFTACASGIAYTGLTLDEHEFLVRAVDAAGNADPSPAEHSWEIGDIPPAVTIESGPAATTQSTSAALAFSAPESGLAFECALDGGAWSACTSPRSYSGLALGSHTFQVRVFSPAAIVPVPIASHTWTVVDQTAPETTITSGPSATTTSTTATFVFSSSESGSTFECSLDGAAYTACIVPASYSALGLGSHTFSVRATDPSGNADATPATHAWTIASSCSSVTTQTVGANADSWIDQASPSQNSGTDSTLKVRSKSGSQNARALVRFNLPAVPAGCVVQAATLRLFSDSAVNGRTLQALRVTATWSENGVTWANQPATNGASATTSSGTGWRQWSVLAHVQAMYSGANNGFLVRDATENAGASPEQSLHSREKGTDMPQLVLTFGPPDTSPPDTTIGSGPAATTSSTSASFSFTSSESGSTFQCSLDGAAFTACTSPAAYTGLGLGARTFAVRATDAAGNVDPTPASHPWTIQAPPPDTTPPDTTLAGQPANPTSSTSASFTLSSSESGSTFQCSLDGAAFTACTSPAAYSGLALGAHTFAARATDAAGNVDPTPATYAWTISASCSTLTLTATADSWIDQASSSQNKGTDSSLKIRSKNGSQNVRSLVRFDLPAIPAGCVVQGATLRLFSDSAVNGRTLQALRANASWTENGVTWANQPSTTGSAATTSSGTGWRQWNVLSQLQAMYSGANNGFLIRDATEGAGAGPEQSFHSREKGSEAPQLVITLVAG